MTSIALGMNNGVALPSAQKKVISAKDLKFILSDDDDDENQENISVITTSPTILSPSRLDKNSNFDTKCNGFLNNSYDKEIVISDFIASADLADFRDETFESDEVLETGSHGTNSDGVCSDGSSVSLPSIKENFCGINAQNTVQNTGNLSENIVASMTSDDSVTNDVERCTPPANSDELELLAKLEEANRVFEADTKSTKSLKSVSPPISCKATTDTTESNASHSRQNSLSSQLSSASNSSSAGGPQLELVDEGAVIPDDLWSAWRSVVDEWDTKYKKKTSYIKDLVRKGIPHHFRGFVWPLLCGAQESQVKERYLEYLRASSPFEKLIRRDISRTYPEHDMFKELNGVGQESLFNVIKAYSIHDQEVGYCQGSGFIVGLLLMQMPEEDAFAVFVRIMQEYRQRELYKPSMAEIGLCIYQLECMIQDLDPELYSHFQLHGLFASMFASPWFLTLFATSLPLPLACRVLDLFLSEGMESIFRVGFAMLQMCSYELQKLDMEGMIKLLTKELPSRLENMSEQLFSTAFQVKYNSRKKKKVPTATLR